MPETGGRGPDLLNRTETERRGGFALGNNELIRHAPDLPKQRKLIRFHISGDPKVFAQKDVGVDIGEKDAFLRDIRLAARGKVVTDLSLTDEGFGILKGIPQMSETDRRKATEEGVKNYSDMISYLRGRVDPNDLSEMLSTGNSETPTNFNRFFGTLFTDSPEDFQRADELAHLLYGERQEYLEALSILMDEALGVKRDAKVDGSKRPPTEGKGSSNADRMMIDDLEREAEILRRERDEAKNRAANAERENETLKASGPKNKDLERLQRERDEALRRASRAELENVRLRNAQRQAPPAGGVPQNDMDPDGYYQALGLDPLTVRDMPEEAILAQIKGARRATGLAYHTDRANGNAGKMKRANAAADFLSDPLKRRGYGRR